MSTYVSKNIKSKVSRKFVRFYRPYTSGRTDGHSDGYDETNCRFSLANAPKKYDFEGPS